MPVSLSGGAEIQFQIVQLSKQVGKMLLYETIIIQKVTVYKEPLVPDSALFMPSGLRITASPCCQFFQPCGMKGSVSGMNGLFR